MLSQLGSSFNGHSHALVPGVSSPKPDKCTGHDSKDRDLGVVHGFPSPLGSTLGRRRGRRDRSARSHRRRLSSGAGRSARRGRIGRVADHSDCVRDCSIHEPGPALVLRLRRVDFDGSQKLDRRGVDGVSAISLSDERVGQFDESSSQLVYISRRKWRWGRQPRFFGWRVSGVRGQGSHGPLLDSARNPARALATDQLVERCLGEILSPRVLDVAKDVGQAESRAGDGLETHDGADGLVLRHEGVETDLRANYHYLNPKRQLGKNSPRPRCRSQRRRRTQR